MKIEAAARLHAARVSDIDKALKKARARVGGLEFGTHEWETAMAEVRKLVDLKNAATDFGKHVSHEGDVIGM